jgi:hypothetical protein
MIRIPSGWYRHAARTLVLALTAWLSACGGGDGSESQASVSLAGTAATGAPIAGATVQVVNAQGTRATAITAADGSFTVTVADAPPYLLSVTDAQGHEWFSYAAADSARANITPLTTLALAQANGGAPLSALPARWASQPITPAQVLQAAAVVNANLQALMQSQGVDPTRVNVFTEPFSANHAGLDAVLDAMRVSFECSATACSQTIARPDGSTLLTWNANIATGSITISWTGTAGGGTGGTGGGGGTISVSLGACTANPTPGSWSMVVQTSVSGVAGVTVPDVCIDGLPGKPASQDEFCNDAAFRDQLPAGVTVQSCSWADPTATISATINQGITFNYSVRYTFVQR